MVTFAHALLPAAFRARGGRGGGGSAAIWRPAPVGLRGLRGLLRTAALYHAARAVVCPAALPRLLRGGFCRFFLGEGGGFCRAHVCRPVRHAKTSRVCRVQAQLVVLIAEQHGEGFEVCRAHFAVRGGGGGKGAAFHHGGDERDFLFGYREHASKPVVHGAFADAESRSKVLARYSVGFQPNLDFFIFHGEESTPCPPFWQDFFLK